MLLTEPKHAIHHFRSELVWERHNGYHVVTAIRITVNKK